ncbi:hypothetical protein NR798_28265 [Archangium gephyra]|uniref:hypothetical protein n=1 Tax=Archangium gephyra TaxID=48 RepID=UPI0035D4A3D2
MRRRLPGRGVVVGVVLAVASAASAAGQEEPERFEWPIQSFFLSDVPQVQEPGAVQAQATFHLRDTPEGTQFEAPLEGEVGVSRRLQLSSEVEWSREWEQGELSRGVSQVEVGARYRLLESAGTGFSLSTGLAGEVSRADFSDDRWGFSAPLLAFKKVGPLGLNAVVRPGFAYTRRDELEPRVALGMGVAVGSRLVVPMGEVRAELGEEDAFEAVGGLKVKPGKVVELGAGALVGRRGGDGVWGATTTLLIDLGD